MREFLSSPFLKGARFCEFLILSFLSHVVNDFYVMGSKAVARHPEYDYHLGFGYKEQENNESRPREVEVVQGGEKEYKVVGDG